MLHSMYLHFGVMYLYLHLCIVVNMGLMIRETSNYLTGLPDQPITRHRITLLFHRTTRGQLCVTSS